MNSAIANILKTRLESLSFVDTISGLVTIAEKTSATGTPILFPISRDVSHVDCINGRYTDLVPNDKKKSVIFFEDRGMQQTGKNGKRITYTSNMTLVCWLNLKKLGVTDINVTSLVVGAIIKQLQVPSFNDGVFNRVKITVTDQAIKNKAIFGAYSFRDDAQYLMFPFDYFALNIETDFEINPDCLADFITGTEDDCLNC